MSLCSPVAPLILTSLLRGHCSFPEKTQTSLWSLLPGCHCSGVAWPGQSVVAAWMLEWGSNGNGAEPCIKDWSFPVPFLRHKELEDAGCKLSFSSTLLEFEVLTPFSFNYFDTSVNAPVVVMCNLTSQPWFLSLWAGAEANWLQPGYKKTCN